MEMSYIYTQICIKKYRIHVATTGLLIVTLCTCVTVFQLCESVSIGCVFLDCVCPSGDGTMLRICSNNCTFGFFAKTEKFFGWPTMLNWGNI